MRRTVILLLLFLGLGIAAYMGYKKSSQSAASAALSWDRDFKIKDISKVGKIFVADKRGRTATLDKQKDGSWMLDGKRKVLPSISRNMLEVMESLEYQYILSEAEAEGVVKRMVTSGIKVEMYDLDGEKLITFYVGPNARNHEGTYFMKEGSERPQIMNMPGFVGDLRPRFEIRGIKWWDKTVVGVKAEDIEAIELSYPKQKSKSFKLHQSGGDWVATPLDPLVPVRKQTLNKDVVEVYLEGFESKVAAGFRNGYEGRDSIVQQVPFAQLSIKKKGVEQPQKVNFFPIFPEERDDASVLTSTDIVRMWAEVEGGDFYTTQVGVFAPLFRSYQSFYQ